MARGSAGESALHRHLRVLDAFDVRRPFLTLTEIAERSGLPLTTTHRLVAELTREGLLERVPDRTFRLGIRLWEFASRTPGALGLREVARPWMQAVHDRIRQHTQLGVLSGHDVLFIERISDPAAVVNATLIGGRLALPLSSSGLVLLAHADADLVDRVAQAGWPRPTPQAYRDGAALRAALRQVRSRGYAALDGHIHLDSRGIAVPVLGPLGSVYAALSVVVPNDDSPPQRLVDLLTVAAAGIARALRTAYLPDGAAASDAAHVQPLISTSKATLDYFASVDPGIIEVVTSSSRRPHAAPGDDR